ERTDGFFPRLSLFDLSDGSAVVRALPNIQDRCWSGCRKAVRESSVAMSGKLKLGWSAAHILIAWIYEPNADMVLRGRPTVYRCIELNRGVIILVFNLPLHDTA